MLSSKLGWCACLAWASGQGRALGAAAGIRGPANRVATAGYPARQSRSCPGIGVRIPREIELKWCACKVAGLGLGGAARAAAVLCTPRMCIPGRAGYSRTRLAHMAGKY